MPLWCKARYFGLCFFMRKSRESARLCRKRVSRNIIAMFLECSVVIIFFAFNIRITWGKAVSSAGRKGSNLIPGGNKSDKQKLNR